MLKHYVEFFRPGSFFAETSVQEIESANAPVRIPSDVYAFRRFDREEVIQDGELLLGKPKNHSPMTYFGEELTLDEVKKLNDRDYSILISNMECNGYKKVVRTILGNFQPLAENDRVVRAER